MAVPGPDNFAAARDLLGLSVALGVGLLVGAERERRKVQQSDRSAAGIRTFALAALAGAISLQLGGLFVFGVVTAIVGGLAMISAWSGRDSDDPGATTEVALVLTLLLGGLAMRAPGLAGMAGVVCAILLAARTPLHRLVGSVLTKGEVRDALILAGATLVVLPLLPDRTFGPYAALNPRSVWILVILVLSVGAGGHVAVRLAGVRFGLVAAGFLAGFVSSAATIGAMGGRARADPGQLPAASAAAVLSTVATMLQWPSSWASRVKRRFARRPRPWRRAASSPSSMASSRPCPRSGRRPRSRRRRLTRARSA